MLHTEQGMVMTNGEMNPVSLFLCTQLMDAYDEEVILFFFIL
jgi:hypothetical protein